MTTDLLPSSSSQLEKDLSLSSDLITRLGASAETIRTSKFSNINDSILGWLIYEYGLGEILPYVPDTQKAVAEGIQWQRIRGTKAAVATALGWIDFTATIEESEAGTLRWADFQLGLDQAPNGLAFTQNVIEVSKLSSPVRSKLFRLYSSQYDFRRFALDDTDLSSGSWLADHSGVYLFQDQNWPQLSFARNHKGAASPSASPSTESAINRTLTDLGFYEDRTLLDIHKFGENPWRGLHIQDISGVISRLVSWTAGPWWYRLSDKWTTSNDTWESLNTQTWETYNYNWQGPQADLHTWEASLDWAQYGNKLQKRSFAKAGIYLSDYAELGNENCVFSPRFREETGFGAFVLSEGDLTTGEGVLSEHKATFEFAEILERFVRVTEIAGLTDTSVQTLGIIESSRSSATSGRIEYGGTFLLDNSKLSEFIPVKIVEDQALKRVHTDFISDTFWPQGIDSEHKKVITIVLDPAAYPAIGERLHVRELYATWERFIDDPWITESSWAGLQGREDWVGTTQPWDTSGPWFTSEPWTTNTAIWDNATWDGLERWNVSNRGWGQYNWYLSSGGWDQSPWGTNTDDWQNGKWNTTTATWQTDDWVGSLTAWNVTTLTIESVHTTTN